jgi:UrcA family protein
LAGIGALAFVATAASAQDYGRSDEEVDVYAPHYSAEPGHLNGTLGKVSLSRPVRYDDLDLRTRDGAHELRMRVRDEARDICERLADIYPVYEANGTSCYKTAEQDALIKANAAISDARDYTD